MHVVHDPSFVDDPSPLQPQPPSTHSAPSPELLERLDADQRASFLRVWDGLPPHLREIHYDLHGPGWTPAVIDELGAVLRDFPDVFSTSKTDFGACSILPFKISLPPDTAPVTSRPYRINPIVSKQVDAILDQYLAAGLIQHSNSPFSSPLVVIPKKDGGVRITVNYKKLNKISSLGQLPIPRVDEVLDSLGKGKIFSLFDLVSSFHQITAHPDTVPLTAFCTPTQLFEWLVMPQGSNAAPGWFVKVINEVTRGLERVVAYLDDVIVFDAGPSDHIPTIRAFFQRLRQYNLKLSPSKARLGATNADFLGHTISPAGVSPNADKVRALTDMPMPKDLKQLRSLLGGLSYYRKFLPNMAKRIRPITSLLKQGAKFVFTSDMGAIVRKLLAELSTPPILVFPDWDAVTDGSRPFRLYCDASIDGFGATLEQEQPDGSVRPIVFISRATLDNERHWTPLDLEAGSIVWSIKRLRGYLWSTPFSIFSDHKALESLSKIGEKNARVQRWLEYLTAFRYTLEYRKGASNGNADFLSRLPLAPTDQDRHGSTSLAPPTEESLYLIRSCGFTSPASPTPGVGLGGLVPSSPGSTMGGLPMTAGDFQDFRLRGPRVRLDLAVVTDTNLAARAEPPPSPPPPPSTPMVLFPRPIFPSLLPPPPKFPFQRLHPQPEPLKFLQDCSPSPWPPQISPPTSSLRERVTGPPPPPEHHCPPPTTGSAVATPPATKLFHTRASAHPAPREFLQLLQQLRVILPPPPSPRPYRHQHEIPHHPFTPPSYHHLRNIRCPPPRQRRLSPLPPPALEFPPILPLHGHHRFPSLPRQRRPPSWTFASPPLATHTPTGPENNAPTPSAMPPSATFPWAPRPLYRPISFPTYPSANDRTSATSKTLPPKAFSTPTTTA